MYPYQPMYQQQMPFQQQAQPQQANNQTMQIQNGGFVPIRDENMVYSYPVEYGKCVTFKVEGQPIVLEKSMGFSQLEAPKIKRYRLVEEETTVNEQVNDLPEPEWKSEISDVQGKISALEKDIQYLKAKARTDNRKKGENQDDTKQRT